MDGVDRPLNTLTSSRTGPGRRPSLVAPALLALLAAVVTTACGSATTSPPVQPGGTASTTTTSTTAPAATRVVNEADNGASVTVAPGTTVQLVLSSTYWSVTPLAGRAVLAAVGDPVTTPRLQGCVPGQGCGTVVATYRAVAPGTVTLAAGRTICGEALACRPDMRSYTVTVTVG